MADEQRPEEVQRWTAKRRAALVAYNSEIGSDSFQKSTRRERVSSLTGTTESDVTGH